MENLYSFIVVKNFNEYLNAFKKGYFPEYIIWNNPNSTKEIEDYLFRSNRKYDDDDYFLYAIHNFINYKHMIKYVYGVLDYLLKKGYKRAMIYMARFYYECGSVDGFESHFITSVTKKEIQKAEDILLKAIYNENLKIGYYYLYKMYSLTNVASYKNPSEALINGANAKEPLCIEEKIMESFINYNEETLKYSKYGIEVNSSLSMMTYAEILLDGKLVPPNYDLAYELFEKSFTISRFNKQQMDINVYVFYVKLMKKCPKYKPILFDKILNSEYLYLNDLEEIKKNYEEYLDKNKKSSIGDFGDFEI